MFLISLICCHNFIEFIYTVSFSHIPDDNNLYMIKASGVWMKANDGRSSWREGDSRRNTSSPGKLRLVRSLDQSIY